MGNCNILEKNQEYLESTQSIRNYQILEVLGKGGSGKVLKVKRKIKQLIICDKKNVQGQVLNKIIRIISSNCIFATLNEKNLLIKLRHPFIINMHSAFQDRESLYLVLDLLTGGDLRFHIAKNKRFSEIEVKFFAACIIISLDYIHQQGIIHRDLKPENLVFDSKGYLRLTDLGIARIWRPENFSDSSGTPGYMAPEVICRQNHGIAVDYYALGIIVYECMLGKRPYVGQTRKEIRDQILSYQVQIRRSDLPVAWTLEAADFVNQLIQRKPDNRLGTNNPSDVKNHPWFKDFDWDSLKTKSQNPPYKPKPIVKPGLSLDSIEIPDDNNFAILRNNTLYKQFNEYCYDPEAEMKDY